jgi:farnesyl-diphosphate farnesyltransferase
LRVGETDARFDAAMRELIGVAHAHLRDALSYTLLIPRNETGIRRFCLWAIGLAVLTLRKIHRTPGYTSGSQVKVSRRSVALTQLLTNVSIRSDWMLRTLFERASSGLPLASVSSVARRPPRAAVHLIKTEFGHGPLHVTQDRSARRSEGRSGL